MRLACAPCLVCTSAARLHLALFALPAVACRGADKAIKNAEGKTAGEVAEMNEQAAVVELLKA